MAEEIEIPGYREAVAQEQRNRSLAFLDLPEIICGIECMQITPRMMEWLRSLENPFVSGGEMSRASVLQFLWIINRDFCRDKAKKDEFINSIIGSLDFSHAAEKISDFLDKTFMDAPYGAPSIPYYCATASLVYSMSREPFRWDYKVTLDTPVRIIYQLIRVDERANGGVVINRLSDKVAGDFLAELNAQNERLKNGKG